MHPSLRQIPKAQPQLKKAQRTKSDSEPTNPRCKGRSLHSSPPWRARSPSDFASKIHRGSFDLPRTVSRLVVKIIVKRALVIPASNPCWELQSRLQGFSSSKSAAMVRVLSSARALVHGSVSPPARDVHIQCRGDLVAPWCPWSPENPPADFMGSVVRARPAVVPSALAPLSATVCGRGSIGIQSSSVFNAHKLTYTYLTVIRSRNHLSRASSE